MTNQQIFNFNKSTNYLEEDFVKDISNQAAFDFLNKFPSWENKLINIFGDQMCGKTFLINIFKKKNNFYYVNDKIDFETKFDELFDKEKLIIDSIDVDDEKMFSLINHFILHKKVFNSSIEKTNHTNRYQTS
jgi:chromosomal replication initiation ATPase DnaA